MIRLFFILSFLGGQQINVCLGTSIELNKKHTSFNDDTLKIKDIEIIILKYFNSDSVFSVSIFDNRKISMYQEYYSNGNLKISGSFNSTPEDTTTKYISTIAIHDGIGLFEEIEEVHNSPKIGQWKYYFPNGQIQISGNFQGNQRDGLWQFYGCSGEVTLIREYKDGILINEKNFTTNSFYYPP